MCKIINFRKAGISPLVCVAVVCFQLLVFNSWSQTFGGGNGTASNPYKISTPSHLVELSNYVNSDSTCYDVKNYKTYGKYFVMTNNIDMTNISNFIPIGISDYNGTRVFCGYFDGKGFSIKNLTIIDNSEWGAYVALFGRVDVASISNLTIDKAFFSSPHFDGRMAVFVVTADSLIMENCMALNCILKADVSSCAGLLETIGKGRISNCHVINAKIENGTGFCGLVGQKAQIINSSVSHSLFTGAGAGGFAGTTSGSLSNCFVSNCVLSAESTVYGFANTASGEINNCYVQATLSRTGVTNQYESVTVGFIGYSGIDKGEHGFLSLKVSNCYAACEITSNDNVYTYDATFGDVNILAAGNTFTNNYYLTHPQFLPAFQTNSPASGVIEKNETELKDAAMVASATNSLNHNQISPMPWKQDLSVTINKGYPIFSWQQHNSYVSTYYPANLTETSATLQGFVFTNGEPIVERGFQWRKKGTSGWTTIQITDTTANISHSLTGLTKGTAYEYFTYMKTSATQHGDTVQFAFGNVGISETIQDAVIRIFPNPTNGKITISNEKSTINNVEMFNIVGQVVGTWQATSTETTIDISHLSNGIYFMKIDGKTAKIVKQ